MVALIMGHLKLVLVSLFTVFGYNQTNYVKTSFTTKFFYCVDYEKGALNDAVRSTQTPNERHESDEKNSSTSLKILITSCNYIFTFIWIRKDENPSFVPLLKPIRAHEIQWVRVKFSKTSTLFAMYECELVGNKIRAYWGFQTSVE